MDTFPIFGNFSDPKKVGSGINVNSEETSVTMNDHRIFRSVQLNMPFQKNPR